MAKEISNVKKPIRMSFIKDRRVKKCLLCNTRVMWTDNLFNVTIFTHVKGDMNIIYQCLDT